MRELSWKLYEKDIQKGTIDVCLKEDTFVDGLGNRRKSLIFSC